MKKSILAIFTVLLSFFMGITVTACNKAKTENGEIKTTATKSEWDSALTLKNVTAKGFATENGKQETVLFKIADTVYYSENDGYISWGIEKNGEYYVYTNDSQEWQKVNGVKISVGTILMSFHLPEFESFNYDEATKSYVCENPDYPDAYYKYNVYFENGYIVKFESRAQTGVIQYSFEFTNYGKTVVEMPNEDI